ncbi:MAG: shikimate dehydrogenase [Polyangiaceae bacterium]|nr:shikimate dehydrogenase [Polyangiaceae bacterium]
MTTITAQTRVCGILGHPVGHSLSPVLHNVAFAARGLPFAYVAHDVRPEDLPAAIAGARALGYRGLSVTIPHKVAAMACVDEVDPTARGIGCINTVVNTKGRLRGHNSDGLGALGALRAAGVDPAGHRVVVLGSGGAARAIAMTLALEAPPAKLSVLGVVPEELAILVSDLTARGRAPVEGLAFDEATLGAALAGAELLLNCTPVGMHPKTDASPVPARYLRRNLSVLDAVYNPRRTQLLKDAAATGATVVEGLEMFLGQAVVQFELFTGEPAPVEVMRQVLEANL